MLGVKYETTANYLGYLLFTKLRRDRQTDSMSIFAEENSRQLLFLA
ncbi:MAG TPA: hypothetical protein IGS40_03490 [Trichormus sp. M33_DOE_039]|nr:hypothetical protein [Trichormus sp. M33_DOE_039]